MWTQPIVITKGPLDADVQTYKLFRNGTLATQGSWPPGANSLTVNDTVADDGSYSWHATLSDAVPNESGASLPSEATLDHNAPVVILGALPAQIENTETFEFNATATDNLGGPITMRAEFAGVQLQEIQPGTWQVNPSGMPPGTYAVRVFATDQQGLEGQASANVEVTAVHVNVTMVCDAGLVVSVNGTLIHT